MSKLTKMHFIAAAEIVRKECVGHQDKERMAEGFISLFRQFNGAFDTGRFRDACGLNGPATIRARHNTTPREIDP